MTPKLTEYVEMAATEYLQEMGETELDALWIAEFFQDNGVQDAYPRQDMIAFYEMVQKELTKRSDRADKQARMRLDKIIHFIKPSRKPQSKLKSLLGYNMALKWNSLIVPLVDWYRSRILLCCHHNLGYCEK